MAIERTAGGYRALLRYEALQVMTEPRTTQEEAVHCLIDMLHARGYRRLKTQVSVHQGVYLGSQALWMEYPDPPTQPVPRGWRVKLAEWVRLRVDGTDP